jgi:hypothetical protein
VAPVQTLDGTVIEPHPGNAECTIDTDDDGLADDRLVEIPAVGAAGGAPLPGFLEGMFGPTPGTPAGAGPAPTGVSPGHGIMAGGGRIAPGGSIDAMSSNKGTTSEESTS